MILRRHPRGVELGAWFDGEGGDRVGAHVARCRSCQRRTSDMARLRSWLRAQPFVAMHEDDQPSGRPRHLWRPVALAAVVLAGFMFVSDRRDTRVDGDQVALDGEAPSPDASAPPPTVASDPSGAPESLTPGESPPEPSPPQTSPSAPRPTTLSPADPPTSAGPLRLGLVVPLRGAQAAEGAAVERIVRQRVEAANTAGGVAGFPVSLVVVAAEDRPAVLGLSRRVDALVGGFGAEPPPGIPWLLPADPGIVGPGVVPADLGARAAGAQLAQTLVKSGLQGPIGVIVGTGPDAAMAAGLASRAAITTVNAPPGTSCTGEILQLTVTGATALAIAGGPELAADCLRAVARSPWRPLFGTVVPPSAIYGGLEHVPEAIGARTLMALPSPTSLLAGAARFRATTESTSYRALVSYAATELAIDVARQAGDISVASVAAGTWRSDLVDLIGTTNRSTTVVSAFLGTWLPLPLP